MSLPLEPRLLACLAVALVATPLLARLAERRGWTDDPSSARKLQGRAVPTVGGLALVLALLPGLPLRTAMPAAAPAWVAALTPSAPAVLATLLLALAVGHVDDRRPGGLAPGAKLAGQALALLPLAADLALAGRPAAGALLVVLGLVALNVLNTFDNADGAVATLGVAGLAAALPAGAAALLGFAPWNLDARRRGDGAPTAYLGDAGAFAAASLVLATPLAWATLWIPALDLARLAPVRWRAGSRPWIGDRRHLAHRLAARGLTPGAVAGVQVLLALPALAGWTAGLATDRPLLAGLGLGSSLLAFLAALRLAPAPSACPSEGASE